MVYVRCTHTKGNRVQACILVRVADRMACIPIGPAENAAAKILGGVAAAGVGILTVRLGTRSVDVSQLTSVEELDAAVVASSGFYVGTDWLYRTRVPVIGTMLMHGTDVISTRERMPTDLLEMLTLNRAPPSSKVAKFVAGIGAAIVAIGFIVFLATGSLDALLGIGFWGIVMIATSLYAWMRLRRV